MTPEERDQHRAKVGYDGKPHPETIIHADHNTDISAMNSADEVLTYCHIVAQSVGDTTTMASIREAQRRLRRRTQPDLFNPDGSYR